MSDSITADFLRRRSVHVDVYLGTSQPGTAPESPVLDGPDPAWFFGPGFTGVSEKPSVLPLEGQGSPQEPVQAPGEPMRDWTRDQGLVGASEARERAAIFRPLLDSLSPPAQDRPDTLANVRTLASGLDEALGALNVTGESLQNIVRVLRSPLTNAARAAGVDEGWVQAFHRATDAAGLTAIGGALPGGALWGPFKKAPALKTSQKLGEVVRSQPERHGTLVMRDMPWVAPDATPAAATAVKLAPQARRVIEAAQGRVEQGARLLDRVGAQTFDTRKVAEAAAAAYDGGVTYHPKLGNLGGTEAYAVAKYKGRERPFQNQPTADDIQRFIEDNLDVYRSDPDASVGGWFDQETQTHFLDVSYAVKDRRQAMETARQHQQKAIFNLKTFEDIPTEAPATLEGVKATMAQTESMVARTEAASKAAVGETVRLFPDVIEEYAVQSLRDAKSEVKQFASELADPSRANDLTVLFEASFKGAKLGLKTTNALASVGAAKIARGARGLKAWEAAMVQEFGEAVRPHLNPAMYEKSQDVFEVQLKDMIRKTPTIGMLEKLTQEEAVQAGKVLRAIEMKDWYPVRDQFRAIFGEDADIFVKLLAATSPNTGVERNVEYAVRAYKYWKSEMPIGKGMHMAPREDQLATANKARQRIEMLKSQGKEIPYTLEDKLRGEKGNKLFVDTHIPNIKRALAGGKIDGNKAFNFYLNLSGHPDAVTNDTHMYQILFGAGKPPAKITDAQYQYMTEVVREVAARLGLNNRQAQAVLWSGKKLRDGLTKNEKLETIYETVKRVAEKEGVFKHLESLPGAKEASQVGKDELAVSMILGRAMKRSGALSGVAQ